jgi:hypothetical protein
MSNTEVSRDLTQLKQNIDTVFTTSEFTINDINHYTLRWYFERDGMMPEIYLFKRVSGSLYRYLKLKYSKNKE